MDFKNTKMSVSILPYHFYRIRFFLSSAALTAVDEIAYMNSDDA